MNELQSLGNKFVPGGEEEVIEEPANSVFDDNMIIPSMPQLSKKHATPLYDKQTEKRWRIFHSPVAEEPSENWQLISEITGAIVPAVLTALQQCASKTSPVQSVPPSCEAGFSQNPT